MDNPSRRPSGFTLIEVVVVLLIFGFVLAMAAAVTRGVLASQNRSITTSRMAGVDNALMQFVQQQKRLPCPADGSLDSSSNNAGVEARNAGACTGNQANGVVPWRTLAITETDATDGWNRRLTYRLDATLGADSGMDMSACDPAGTGGLVGGRCNAPPACSSASPANCTPPATFLQNKGLTVKTVAGVVVMDPTAVVPTGAAYVVISAGETGGGGYLNSGTLGASTVTDGNEEMKNYASQGYVAGVTYYLDDALNTTSGATHFDDVVSRPSVLSLANKASLGPRAH